jgi:ribonucleoside-triphosphate reductase
MSNVFVGLTEEFLAPYRQKGDPFESLLARSTYLTKYCRDGETWTDTILRVVVGNVSLDPISASVEEAQELFDLFWTMQALPPGRGLWTGGVLGIIADARYNCWFTTIRGIDDWCWVANQLMLGGGVGNGLRELDTLPTVSAYGCDLAIACRADHPNVDEVVPDGYFPTMHDVQDSREGWVTAIRQTLEHAFAGLDLSLNVTPVRERGRPIKTFGGIACGPGPLVAMLRAVWGYVRGAEGRKLTRLEALDITNHIGLCIKSGNVRRSALITLGDPNDQAFRDAKKDLSVIQSHRHTSNNTLAFWSEKELREFDWASLVEDMAEFGEPGIANMPLVWATDPGAKGVNPCGEQFLWDREACNLAEVFPARIPSERARLRAFELTTRYCLRQRLTDLSDPTSDAVGKRNMRVGVAIGGLCDFPWSPLQLNDYYSVCRGAADEYADELGVNRPITVTTVKPSGTISLLNGSSPGMHAPHAPYYIRRVRIAKNDPQAPAMIEAGVPHEECTYDATKRTWVFSFPVSKATATVFSTTETIRDQFERQVALQEHWADNAVSATLSFHNHEKAELVGLLREFVPRLKSTSCLPRSHGYVQAPYEECSREEYEKRYAEIDHGSKLVSGGDFDIDECANGVCPVR